MTGFVPGDRVGGRLDLLAKPAFTSAIVPGFCSLEKRSTTLAGSLPQRAAQHCLPVLMGNAIGLQIKALETTRISWDADSLNVASTKSGNELIHEVLPDAIEELAARGVIAEHGYWHRLFSSSAIAVEDDSIFVWTGFMIGGSESDAVIVDRAYNRGPWLEVTPHLVAQPEPVPLVVEIHMSAIGEVWLDREIGSIVSVPLEGLEWRCEPIREHPRLIEVTGDFYSEEYWALKRGRGTGRYRKLVKGARPKASAPTSLPHGVLANVGPHRNRTSSMRRMATPTGWESHTPWSQGFPCAEIGLLSTLSAKWNGDLLTDFEGVPSDEMVEEMRRAWRAVVGERYESGLRPFVPQFGVLTHGEPYVFNTPWTLALTPPGWVTLLNGRPLGVARGMRAVIETDVFHAMPIPYHLNRPGPIGGPAGQSQVWLIALPRDYVTRDPVTVHPMDL